MAFKQGNKQAKGGMRPGAGRKKSQITIAREQFLAQQEQHAQDAFAFQVETLHDKKQPRAIRSVASQIIMDRIWGKSTGSEKIDGELLIRIIRDGKNN